MFSLQPFIPHYWDKTFLRTLPNPLWVISFSSWTGGNRHCSWLCVSAVHSSLSSFLMFSPLFSGICSHAFVDKYSVKHSKVTLCNFLGFTLPLAFSFLVLFYHLNLPWSPRLLALFPQVRQLLGFHLGSISLCHNLEAFKAVYRDKAHRFPPGFQGSLFFFDKCPMSWKFLFHVFCVFCRGGAVSDRKINVVPVYSSWPEVEVYSYILSEYVTVLKGNIKRKNPSNLWM